MLALIGYRAVIGDSPIPTGQAEKERKPHARSALKL
jgi:hypothetical protein